VGGNWQVISYSASRSGLSANLGFQGRLGLEFKISPKMGSPEDVRKRQVTDHYEGTLRQIVQEETCLIPHGFHYAPRSVNALSLSGGGSGFQAGAFAVLPGVTIRCSGLTRFLR
jgi:hypothetical protein